MEYKYKTNFDTIEKVFVMAERMGVEWFITGTEVKIEIEKIIQCLFKQGMVNEFCQTVTGQDINFQVDLDLYELEGVILGFFDFMREYSKDLKIMALLKASRQTTAE